MPIVFAPLVGLLLGSALAWAALRELMANGGPVAASRSFGVVAAFAAFVWAPVVGYFAAFHGDWSYLYLVSSRRVPSAVDLVLVLGAAAAVVAGFAAAARPLRSHRRGAVLGGMAVPAVLLASALPLTGRRLAVSATFAQFHGDFGAEPIGSSVLGGGVLFMGTMLALGLGWTAYCLVRMSSERSAGAGRSRRR